MPLTSGVASLSRGCNMRDHTQLQRARVTRAESHRGSCSPNCFACRANSASRPTLGLQVRFGYGGDSGHSGRRTRLPALLKSAERRHHPHDRRRRSMRSHDSCSVAPNPPALPRMCQQISSGVGYPFTTYDTNVWQQAAANFPPGCADVGSLNAGPAGDSRGNIPAAGPPKVTTEEPTGCLLQVSPVVLR